MAEGLNSKSRLINYRGHGHHLAAALIAMISLYAGGITIELSMDRPSAGELNAQKPEENPISEVLVERGRLYASVTLPRLHTSGGPRPPS